ncbi:UNC93-like protein MFSD11 [Amphiura filiformis]|uniref:UNC93-like protein MFSD11 n=1 Tax=Amphiura filiformis TaxID=82378 RepID=UPI003B21E877
MAFDVRVYNIVILGFAFMAVFTAFQTTGIIEQTVINSIKNDSQAHNETDTKSANGYYSLCIVYSVFAAANWIAPSIVTAIGPRLAMFLSAIVYTGFIAVFLKLKAWALYMMSAILGLAAAVIWTAQGNYLTLNSDKETMPRNSGLFWAMFQCSYLFGNLLIYFEFQGQEYIKADVRTTVYTILTVVCGVGVLLFLLLKKPPDTEMHSVNEDSGEGDPEGPLHSIKRAFQLFKMKEMVLLEICFFYTGLELTFFSGVFGTCVGNVVHFGNNAESYIGICGILIGAGEVVGGASFGIFGSKTIKFGRDPIILLGYIVHMAAFYLCFLNFPGNSPVEKSDAATYITPVAGIAFACAFLLGFGDSCFNTQIYSILGSLFARDSAAVFALYKFTQSTAAAAAFFYSSELLLEWQLLIMVVFGTIGTLSFFIVEWGIKASPSHLGYNKI